MNYFYLSLITLFSASKMLAGDCPIPLKCGQLFFLNQMNSSCEIEMKVDFLYWKAASEGLDYAFTYIETTGAGLTVRRGLKVHHADLPWEPSFRVAAGISKNEWDVILSWTRFESHGSGSAEEEDYNPPAPVSNYAPISRRLYRIWMLDNGMTNVVAPDISSINAKYRFLLNTIDWDAGKLIALSRHLFVRPRFGLRAANLLQKMDIVSLNNEPNLSPSDQIAYSDVHLKNDFFGLGIRLGGDAKFHLHRQLALLGDFSFSLLGGQFRLHETEQYTLVSLPNTFFNNPNRFSLKTVKPVLQFGVGAQFASDLREMRSRFEFNIGYEFHYWMDQNQMFRVFSSSQPDVGPIKHPGDVSLHGLTLETALYF